MRSKHTLQNSLQGGQRYMSWQLRALLLGLVLALSGPVNGQSSPLSQLDEAAENRVEQAMLDAQKKQASATAQQQADYEHILFEYFQKQYDTTLMLIEVGDASHQFIKLSQDDQDRLRLMQGASQLNVGLYSQAQDLLLNLLSVTSSEYVQANTWFWLAKAGFENRQYYLSERAYAAIEQEDLIDYIDEQQWQELIYLTTFSRMQQGQDWQSMFVKLDKGSIYPAYIQANYASSQFNNGDFAESEQSFIAAKQSLLGHERIQNSWLVLAGKGARSALSFNWLNPLNWFSSDPNAQSQGQLEQARDLFQQQEIDALYDRINLGLAYSLLQQQDDENALKVINTVSKRGGESEQALLTLGWALAQQNRWQNAISVWQYLQEQSEGLYGLQASYGMAYAYQQQGDFSQAFFALDDTTSQILNTIDALQNFSERVKDDGFFDSLEPVSASMTGEQSLTQNNISAQSSSQPKRVESISELAVALGLEPSAEDKANAVLQDEQIEYWPSNLLDIKRMFLSTQPDFDAYFLLNVRREAKQVLANLDQKTQQLNTLAQMLSVRQQRFAKRQQELSLSDVKAELEQANAQLVAIQDRLTDPQQRQTIKLEMASQDQLKHIQRINNAQQRLTRLLNDDTRSRPLNPKLKLRLERVQGILQWQLDDEFVVNHWQHKRFVQQAQRAVLDAKNSYERLVKRQKDSQLFAEQQQSLQNLAIEIQRQQAQARAVYSHANAQLQNNLLMIVERRIQALNTQQVNTRLAKLRLQDLTPEAQQ
ncbi:hypothetical protein [Glaciecola sp. SC05]|uniref:hypothetical protein n=1 Tax=Glaciecola sp. SC05 TaxID=1987355 RepID=UPI0035270A1D